eukprot:scaffold19192_cov67-Phaeocystis_antarctica.AAC.6
MKHWILSAFIASSEAASVAPTRAKVRARASARVSASARVKARARVLLSRRTWWTHDVTKSSLILLEKVSMICLLVPATSCARCDTQGRWAWYGGQVEWQSSAWRRLGGGTSLLNSVDSSSRTDSADGVR